MRRAADALLPAPRPLLSVSRAPPRLSLRWHPQDLYDSIAQGEYPEWRLMIQTMDPDVSC